MSALTKFRQWVNRDDGRFYRAGNRHVGVIEVVGLLLVIAALVLGQLHAKVGISAIWSLACGVVGLLVATLGARRGHDS